MDLKHLYVKVDKILNEIKEEKNENLEEKKVKDKIFELLFPLIESYPKIKGYFDDDLIQDFVVYMYQRFELVLKKFTFQGKFSSYFYIVLRNNFFNFIKNKSNLYKKNVFNEISIDSVNDSAIDFKKIYSDIVDKNILEIDKDLDSNKYKKLINSYLKKLNDDDKVIFLLYNYEIIDGKWLIFISKNLNKSPIEINNIILKFREKNLNKYKRKEVLYNRILHSRTLEKSLQYKKELESILFYGDLDIIASLINRSKNGIKTRLARIKNKLKNEFNKHSDNFKS